MYCVTLAKQRLGVVPMALTLCFYRSFNVLNLAHRSTHIQAYERQCGTAGTAEFQRLNNELMPNRASLVQGRIYRHMDKPACCEPARLCCRDCTLLCLIVDLQTAPMERGSASMCMRQRKGKACAGKLRYGCKKYSSDGALSGALFFSLTDRHHSQIQ